jgi:hypothetical protein
MVLAGQAAVGGLDLLLGGVLRNPEDLVVVLVLDADLPALRLSAL